MLRYSVVLLMQARRGRRGFARRGFATGKRQDRTRQAKATINSVTTAKGYELLSMSDWYRKMTRLMETSMEMIHA